MDLELEMNVRLTAFNFLRNQVDRLGETLPRKILQSGFSFQGKRVPLVSPQGIYTPKLLDVPLSFTTVPPSLRKNLPYDDELGENGVVRYRYRGSDVMHPDNVGMRKAGECHLPLVYFFGIVPGEYVPVWPCFVVEDDPVRLSFSIQVGDAGLLSDTRCVQESNSETRQYITVLTQRRLHQRSFRDRVLHAYSGLCAVCRLKHVELLDAAHILSDKHPQGKPVIPNGLSLCKLHHAAFDQNILGVTPDYTIDIRDDVLREHDGPMLKHGLQEMKGVTLWTPRLAEFKPNRDFLDIRYQAFRQNTVIL